MKRPVVWILAGLLAYLVMLIAWLPAAQVVGRIPASNSLIISGVSGTLWQGTADYVEFEGVGVESVQWQLSVLPLLFGKASLDITAGNSRDSEQVSIKGPLSMGLFSKRVQAESLTVYAPADLVMDYVPMPFPLTADGRIRLNLDTFDFDQNCQELQGKGQWLNATIANLNPPLSLGDFNAALSCRDGQFVMDIQEPNSLELSAEVVVAADMQYTINGRFRPSDQLPQVVRDGMRLIGSPDAQGYITLEF